MNVKLATAFVALAAAAAAPLSLASAPGTFSPTGSMATARQAPFGATMADGRVLVGSGFDGSYLTSAEIYSPAAGSFAPTGSLGHARENAAAAPLPDGRVLVAGGYNPTDTRLDTATVFKPTLNGGVGDFSAAGIGTMSTSREGPIAAPLPDGRVLVAGGRSNSNVNQTSAEIFDPGTNAFTPVPGGNHMVVGREFAAAAPLADGRVLIAGGLDNTVGATATAEVFDPANNTFSAVGSMSVPRNGPGAAPLPDGRVLVAGGQDTSFAQLSSAEIFDPATNSFSSAGVGTMSVERQFPATAPLQDGRVLVAGGRGLGPIATSTDLFTLAPRAPFTFRVRGTKLIFTAPVAGTVSVNDARAKSVAAATTAKKKHKKKKKPLSLRPSSESGGPGEITVALSLTGKAKKRFKATGKAKAKATISFAPKGECATVAFKSCYDAGTETVALKLKNKKKRKK
jgi:Kelch motif